jgi:hypothetical protein
VLWSVGRAQQRLVVFAGFGGTVFGKIACVRFGWFQGSAVPELVYTIVNATVGAFAIFVMRPENETLCIVMKETNEEESYDDEWVEEDQDEEPRGRDDA